MAETTTTLTSKSTLHHIPIGDLYPSPLNRYELTDIPSLKNSIEVYGLLEPLSVCGPDSAGKYEVLCGNRRHKACTLIHEEDGSAFSSVPCHIVAGPDILDQTKSLLIEIGNIESREEVDIHAHRMRVIRLLKELEDVAEADGGEDRHIPIIKKAAEYLKITPRYAAMYKAVFESEKRDELQELISNKDVTMPQAQKLANMEPGARESVIAEIKSGAKAKDAMEAYVSHKPKVKEAAESTGGAPASLGESTMGSGSATVREWDADNDVSSAGTEGGWPSDTGTGAGDSFDFDKWLEDARNTAPLNPYADSNDTGQEEESFFLDKAKLCDLLQLFAEQDAIDDEEDQEIVRLCQDIADKFNI